MIQSGAQDSEFIVNTKRIPWHRLLFKQLRDGANLQKKGRKVRCLMVLQRPFKITDKYL
jgi:hypothetical protein